MREAHLKLFTALNVSCYIHAALHYIFSCFHSLTANTQDSIIKHHMKKGRILLSKALLNVSHNLRI